MIRSGISSFLSVLTFLIVNELAAVFKLSHTCQVSPFNHPDSHIVLPQTKLSSLLVLDRTGLKYTTRQRTWCKSHSEPSPFLFNAWLQAPFLILPTWLSGASSHSLYHMNIIKLAAKCNMLIERSQVCDTLDLLNANCFSREIKLESSLFTIIF